MLGREEVKGQMLHLLWLHGKVPYISEWWVRTESGPVSVKWSNPFEMLKGDGDWEVYMSGSGILVDYGRNCGR